MYNVAIATVHVAPLPVDTRGYVNREFSSSPFYPCTTEAWQQSGLVRQTSSKLLRSVTKDGIRDLARRECSAKLSLYGKEPTAHSPILYPPHPHPPKFSLPAAAWCSPMFHHLNVEHSLIAHKCWYSSRLRAPWWAEAIGDTWISRGRIR